MSVEIGEGSGEVEDELFDLNKEPVERKRKRDEKSNSCEKGNEGSNDLTKSGRVLRSMTVAMSDGEKQVIKMDNKVETEVPLMESQDESKAPVLKKRKKKKGKRGRPRKMEDKQEVPPLSCPKKRGRGRPPKAEGKCEISSLNLKKTEGSGASRRRESRKVKRKRGRPPKTEVKCVIRKLESEVMELKNDNSSDGASQCQECPQVKRKRGRPPRMGVNCKISSLSNKQDDEAIELNKVDNSSNGAYQGIKSPKVKRKCGRPPKSGDKHEIRKQDSEVMELMKIDSSNNGAARCQESPQIKRKRGRPPKTGVKCVISSMNKNQDDEVMELKKMDDCSIGASQSQKSPQVKQKCGRPPKRGVKCEIPSLNRKQDDEVIELKKDDSSNGGSQCQKGPKVKRKRGRPPKTGVNCEIPPLNRNQEDKVMEFKKIDGSCNGAAQSPESPKAKRKRGRLPKVENGSLSLVIKKKIVKRKTVRKKIVKRNFGSKKTRNMGPVKRLIVGTNDLGNSVMREKKAKVDSIKGEEMGLREQKQLVRDQIIAMLYKAGWTVEYKQRLSRDYQDAVYVDREGRAYWSVTLAYKMLKARIDSGRAEDKDVLAFSPIPEETFSMLFRIVEKGKRKGKKKNGPVKIIKRKRKEESSKIRSSDGKIKSRQTLLARRPKSKNGSDTDDYEIYEGKRTLLSWMIDLGTVPLGGRVVYKRGRKQRILREGKILKEGICCNCCDITHTIRDFESHAESTLGTPFRYLYLDSGNTLFQCLVDSWKKHVEMDKIEFVCVDVEGDDPNDDTCNVCGDGGDLICCDSCPSTFHNGCLHIKVPSGDWHCDYCSCKFCGMACENTSAADDDDDDDQNLSSELLTCCLCEEKFHLHCINEMIAEDFQDENHSFCGKECSQILEQLHTFLGVRNELGEEFSYTILQHRAISGDAVPFDNYSNIESNSKLSVAFSVMDECFEPIVDERSGTNMIHNVVYSCGSNIRRLNYDGFCTIILEKGDELVSAASIRIHGKQLAEMPFIGTRFTYRRQGMCSRLLTAVETFLRILGVEKLVIPAISQLNQTWTKVFGFLPLEESKRQEMRYMSMIAFPGIDMLQKSVQGHQFTKDSTASEHPEIKPDHQNTKENQSEDIEGLSVSSLKISHEVEDHGNGRDANSESDMTVPIVSLNEGDGRCSDNGNCLDDLNSSNDEDASLKDIMGIDCNIRPEQSDELANGCPIEGLYVSSLMISHEFEDHGKGKDANGESGTTAPIVSLNQEDGRCSDNGKCLDDLNSSKDDDTSLKDNTVIDCNIGLEQSDDVANGRLSRDV